MLTSNKSGMGADRASSSQPKAVASSASEKAGAAAIHRASTMAPEASEPSPDVSLALDTSFVAAQGGGGGAPAAETPGGAPLLLHGEGEGESEDEDETSLGGATLQGNAPGARDAQSAAVKSNSGSSGSGSGSSPAVKVAAQKHLEALEAEL